jgi:hypothetical protein
MASGERRSYVDAIDRGTHAGADQRRRFDDDDAV